MARNPVIPQPVSADDPAWDLQQRNVEERIEAALVHPTLGDGATHVESFHDDDAIQQHMLSADHGKYGLDTHSYTFSVAAQRQFWRWHFENEERIRQARLAEHERKTAEFNRKINERKAAIAEAQPAIRIVNGPQVTSRGLAVRVEALVGSGPGPLQHYAIVHRRPEAAALHEGGWSQWMTSRRPWNLPFQETLLLDTGGRHEIAVMGSNEHGRVVSPPLVVSGTDQAPPQVEDAQEITEADVESLNPLIGKEPAREQSMKGNWVLCWDKLPGIAPPRAWGSLSNPGDVTALFLTDATTLRLTMTRETPSHHFPHSIVAKAGRRWVAFEHPGHLQEFGLGNARDYRLSAGVSGEVIHAGAQDTDIVLVWDTEPAGS